MKVTVEIADSDLSDVLALTGERKKGPAIRLLMEQALQLRRRQRIAERFLSGEWGVEFAGYEEARELERQRLTINPRPFSSAQRRSAVRSRRVPC